MCSVRTTDANTDEKPADPGGVSVAAVGALLQCSAAALGTPRDSADEGDDDPGENPQPAWGDNHLMAITDATATARFAGGGRDMPTVLSAGAAVVRGGRGRWDVRFDKKGAGVGVK
jgi:hypothetical protein